MRRDRQRVRGRRLRAGIDRRAIGVWALLAATGSQALAQSAVLAGNVTSDSAGKRQLVGASIAIPALALSTRTNFGGDYRFAGVAAGRYLVTVTMPGFKSVGDSVTVEGAGETYHDFVMPTPAVVLDTVVAKAPSPARKYLSPGLTGFDERSKQGFGYFIVDSTLRKYDSDRLSDLITARIPDVVLTPGPGGAMFLTSGRKQAKGPTFSSKSGSAMTCWVSVYVDGTLIYNYQMDAPIRGATGESAPTPVRPDFSRLNVSDYAGVEFYASSATYPPWVGQMNNDCGVLLLWTREK